MIEPTISLSQEQIHSFHEDGFLVLNAITTEEEVEQLREIYDRLFSDRTGWDQGVSSIWRVPMRMINHAFRKCSVPAVLRPS